MTTDPEVPDVSCTNMTGRFAGGQPFMDAVRAQAFTGLTGPIKLQVHNLLRLCWFAMLFKKVCKKSRLELNINAPLRCSEALISYMTNYMK